MNKNVYGLIGITAVNSSWNNSWENKPKDLSDGTIYGSDKALKFVAREYWKRSGERVMYVKSMCSKTVKGKTLIVPRTLAERYEQFFGEPVSKDGNVVLENLMSAVDVRQFGATFAEESSNLSIRGVVQIGIGMNLYEDTEVQYHTILSPWKNPKESKAKAGDDPKEKTMVTNGVQSFTDYASYCYPFSINPGVMQEQIDINANIQPYSDDDYKLFLKAAAEAATAYNSCSKSGCSNTYVLIVEGMDNDDLYLNDLSEKASMYVDDDGNKVLNLTKVFDYLDKFSSRIGSIRLYYDDEVIKVDCGGHVVNTFGLEELV